MSEPTAGFKTCKDCGELRATDKCHGLRCNSCHNKAKQKKIQEKLQGEDPREKALRLGLHPEKCNDPESAKPFSPDEFKFDRNTVKLIRKSRLPTTKLATASRVASAALQTRPPSDKFLLRKKMFKTSLPKSRAPVTSAGWQTQMEGFSGLTGSTRRWATPLSTPFPRARLAI